MCASISASPPLTMACCDVRWGVKIYSKYSIYFEWNFDAIILSAFGGVWGRGGAAKGEAVTGQLHKSGV